MILLPAIDLKDGKCVRLTKGDFDTVERVAEDPLDTAISFEEAGAEWIHLVDLDGAKEGGRVNHETILKIREGTSLKVEVGGGIRDMEAIKFYLSRGISRVILGSAALTNPDLVIQAIDKYGDQIVVGVDAKEGMVKTAGWLEASQVSYLDLAQKMVEGGVKTIIFTDINRDGTMTGPNFSQLGQINQLSADIVASGGIRDIEDLKKLKSMDISSAILGKSIYKGTINLKEAIEDVG